jgi:hypothetical protein
MFSFYYGQETTPEYQKYKADTRAVFSLIKAGQYEAFTSPLATDELTDEPNGDKRYKMLVLIPEYSIKIAMTVVNGLDFIVSLNFTHIARPWTIERVRRVNFREGYKPIGIYKPSEVLEL